MPKIYDARRYKVEGKSWSNRLEVLNQVLSLDECYHENLMNLLSQVHSIGERSVKLEFKRIMRVD
jgi:hypothetical protein